MTRDPIFIRVDANPQVGYERLARCLTLAAAIQRRRRPVYFLSNLEPLSIAMQIKRAGNDWIGMDNPLGSEADMKQILRERARLSPNAMILDDADPSPDFVAELRESWPLLISLDHLGLAKSHSHLIINPLLGPSKENYEFRRGTQILMGRRYTLVRPEIRRTRSGRSQEPPPLAVTNGKTLAGQFRALVALGEDDPHRQTLELVKQLLNTPRIGKVDMIVRRDHSQIEEIRAFVEAEKERVELAIEPAEISARMIRCHFAITSGSGWSNELACLGVPQLMILQSEGHWPNAQRLEEEGCANCLGWYENVSPGTIRAAVQNLLSDPLERQSMARCGRKLIDGRGPDRLVTALEIMMGRQNLPVLLPMAA